MPSAGHAKCSHCGQSWNKLIIFDPDFLISICHECKSLVSTNRFLRVCPKNPDHRLLHEDQVFFEQRPSPENGPLACPFCNNQTLTFSFDMIFSWTVGDEVVSPAMKKYERDPQSYEAAIELAIHLFKDRQVEEAVTFFRRAQSLTVSETLKQEIDRRIEWIDQFFKDCS